MESVPLGHTSLVVSHMGLGGNRLGGLPLTGQRRRSTALVEQALAAGVTLFDTADAYGSGTSEVVLGEVLRDVPGAVIATKVGYRFADRSTVAGLAQEVSSRLLRRPVDGYRAQDFSPGALEAAVDASRRRLRRDRIDLLQLHGPPPAASTALPEVIGRLRDDGRIAAFGVGCESVDVARSWLDVEGLDCVQLPFGVLDEAAAAVLPEARRRGIGTIARGALGGGILGLHLRHQPTGLDPARQERLDRIDELGARCDVELGQLAVWFAVAAAPVDAVLLGASSPAQLADCVRWACTPPPGTGILAELGSIVGVEIAA